MATLADSLLSSSARRLSMRRRPDLSARQQRYQGRVYWVVKEPVGLNYFRFQEEEYAILQMLDGEISLDEIKEQFEARFPPQKIGVEELQQFIGMLHKSGLIIANVPGQGKQLKERRDERKRKEFLSKFTNLLSIRFKGVDPDRFLNWLHPRMRWIYSRPAVVVCMLLALSALTLILVQFRTFQSRLPTFQNFFTLENAFYLSIVLGVTKVIHEFGHGLTCKHFGGECHEMGVMVLVLTPCLYCNVSDSWMLPNKWHRAAIGVGGMYIEVVMASIATFIWWFSNEQTLLNQLCLNTMFVCSVSTIIFNSNPLLRYDGYYILSDLIEIPNLRQKATDILSRKMGDWCLGLERPDDPFLPQRNQWLFALYSVAAAVYRWVVVFSIIWFLYNLFVPRRLEIFGKIVALVAMWGLFIQPLFKIAKFFRVPGRIEKVKKPRFYATLAVLGALVALVVYLPLPYRVFAPLEVQPREYRSIYVDVPTGGELERVFVKPGQHVDPGDKLAQLNNLDLELQITRLSGEKERYETQLEGLLISRHHSELAALSIPSVRAALVGVNQQLRQKKSDQRRLTMISPIAGTVIAPPDMPARPRPNGELASWSGSPLEEKNRGCYLRESELLCQVGDPTQLQALIIIDQENIEFIHEGQSVDLKLDELPGIVYSGVIERVSKVDTKVSPRHLSGKAGGDLATKTDPAGIDRPLNISYQARVALSDQDGLLRLGLRGKAKIHARAQTMWQRLWRYVSQTFNFRMG